MRSGAKYQGKRNELVRILIEKGIRDKAVLKAIARVPRHLFLDSSFEEQAYKNQAFPIAAGQTISHPHTVAVQSEQLALKPGAKVLEVGTGSGYQAAVLCEMGFKVYSIERQKELYDFSRHLLPQMGYSLKQYYGDGYAGLSDFAPFDGILVTAGAPYVPQALLDQLKIGARLIIPVGQGSQVMQVHQRTGQASFKHKEVGEFKFVPMLERKAADQ